MQLFLLNKTSYYKRKTAQKIWSAGITKDFLYDQILFVLIQNIHPANSDKKVLLITEDKSEVRL